FLPHVPALTLHHYPPKLTQEASHVCPDPRAADSHSKLLGARPVCIAAPGGKEVESAKRLRGRPIPLTWLPRRKKASESGGPEIGRLLSLAVHDGGLGFPSR